MGGLEGSRVCLCPPTSHHLLISAGLHQSPCSPLAALFLTTCLEVGESISAMYHSDPPPSPRAPAPTPLASLPAGEHAALLPLGLRTGP